MQLVAEAAWSAALLLLVALFGAAGGTAAQRWPARRCLRQPRYRWHRAMTQPHLGGCSIPRTTPSGTSVRSFT